MIPLLEKEREVHAVDMPGFGEAPPPIVARTLLEVSATPSPSPDLGRF